MATSISINGARTSVPGTAADVRFDFSGRALPAAKTLAVIGEFEQFENGQPALVNNAIAMATRAPGDEFLAQAAGILFNPASDPLVGAPGSVLVASSLPSSPATATLTDAAGRPTVRLQSKIFGRYGNAMRFTLAAAPGNKLDLGVTRQGTTNNLTNLGSGPVITATKIGSWAKDLFFTTHSPLFDEGLGDVVGRVLVTLQAELVVGGYSNTVPASERTARSKVTFAAKPVTVLGAATTVATDTFTSSAHGLQVGDPVRVDGLVGTMIGSWSDNHIGYVISDGFGANTFKLGRTPSDVAITLSGVDGSASVTRVAPFGVSTLSGVAVNQGTAVFTKADHGLLVGDPVLVTNFSGTSISGHFTGRVYYVIEDDYDVDTFSLSTSVGGSSVTILVGNGTCTVSYKPTTLTVAGLDGDGLARTQVITVTPGTGQRTFVTEYAMSRVDSVAVSDNGAGSGLLDLFWTVADISRLDAPNLSALAGALGDVPNITTQIRNARAAVLTLADLDFATSVAAPFDFTCNNSELARQVNDRSSFVTASRVYPTEELTQVLGGPFTGVAGSNVVTMNENEPLNVAPGDLFLIGAEDAPLFTFEVASVSGYDITLVEDLPASFSQAPSIVLHGMPSGATAPVIGVQALTGGLTGVADASSRQAMFDALALTDMSVIAVLSYDTTLISAAVEYAKRAAGIGENECNVWVAQPRSTDLDDLDTFTLGLNTRHVSVCAEDIRVIDPTGARRWLDSRFQALQCAAMQAAVPIGEPVTAKRPRVLDTRGGSDWNGQTGPDALIQIGVVSYRRDSLGFLVTRAVTTHRSNDDVNQTEVSANESAYWQIRDMREELRAAIGRSSGVFYPAALITTVGSRAQRQVNARLIASFDETSVSLTQVGDTVVVGYNFAPNVPINFAIVQPTIQTVRFEFNVS